jgi:hypothetical protein
MTCLSDERLGGIAMLPPGDPERKAAEEHARTCPKCGPALRAATSDLAPLELLGAIPAPARLEAVRAKVGAALEDDARKVMREGLVVLLGAGVAAAVAFSLFEIACHGVLPMIELVFALVVATAVALFARNRHRARLGLGLVSVASLVLLALDVDGSARGAIDHGAYCASVIGVTAIVPAAVAAWLSLASLEPSRPIRNAARTGAAALVAQGVLVLLCDNHSVLHLVPFHVLAVLASIGAGAALPALFSRLRRSE